MLKKIAICGDSESSCLTLPDWRKIGGEVVDKKYSEFYTEYHDSQTENDSANILQLDNFETNSSRLHYILINKVGLKLHANQLNY